FDTDICLRLSADKCYTALSPGWHKSLANAFIGREFEVRLDDRAGDRPITLLTPVPFRQRAEKRAELRQSIEFWAKTKQDGGWKGISDGKWREVSSEDADENIAEARANLFHVNRSGMTRVACTDDCLGKTVDTVGALRDALVVVLRSRGIEK